VREIRLQAFLNVLDSLATGLERLACGLVGRISPSVFLTLTAPDTPVAEQSKSGSQAGEGSLGRDGRKQRGPDPWTVPCLLRIPATILASELRVGRPATRSTSAVVTLKPGAAHIGVVRNGRAEVRRPRSAFTPQNPRLPGSAACSWKGLWRAFLRSGFLRSSWPWPAR
jgi:hypothetical protein